MKALASLAKFCFPLCALACASQAHQPPGLPPTPKSITVDEPGGDAADPHLAALERQLHMKWGWRTDKDNQLSVPMTDPVYWKRVRFWTIDHFVGFRYGEDFHGLSVVLVHDVPAGTPMDSNFCMKNAEKWAEPRLRDFQVQLGPITERSVRWKKQDILVHQTDAKVAFGFDNYTFTAAWAAYPAYTDACAVFAFAVPWYEQEALARQVVDRWVREGVRRLKPRTKSRPYRK